MTTPKQPRASRATTRGRMSRRMAVASVVVVAGLVWTTGCALLDNHSQLTVEMLMVDAAEGAVDVTTDPVDITDDACGAELDCVEAYSTGEANYYRFASREQAADYAAALDDGFVIHYIVMDFAGKDTASKQHQLWAMQRLASTWQDYEGTFPDR